MGNGVSKYGNIGEDGCPCGTYKDEHVFIHAHCWKSNGHNCNCKYSGVHYTILGDKDKAIAKAEEISKYIEEAWMTDVEVSEYVKPKEVL
jgi:hypothetical protein